MSNLPDFALQLQPCSFNGVPFGVVPNQSYTFGNRNVTKVYPFIDLPYVEYLGQQPETIHFEAILWGEDVYAQRDALIAALKNGGQPASLVHQSLGSVWAVFDKATMNETTNAGGTVSFSLDFILTSQFQNTGGPIATDDTTQDISDDSDDLDDAADSDWTDDVGASITGAISTGLYTVNAIADTVQSYANQVTAVVSDASAIVNSVAGIGYAFSSDISFGRYASGGLTAAPAALANLPPGLSTTSRVQAAATLLLNNAVTQAATLRQAAQTATQGVSSGSATVPASIQALTDQLRLTLGPSDAIRLLSTLASFTATAPATLGSLGAAVSTATISTASLCRRSALSSLSRAISDYTPSSNQDAQVILGQVIPLYDSEISAASSANDNDSLNALYALKSSVIADLQTKAQSAATIVTLTLADSIPLKRLAMRQYMDASRDEEILERNPQIQHPLFSGYSVEILSK